MHSRNTGGWRDLYSDWNSMIRDIVSCRRCRLHATRKNAVPGEGNVNSKIMIVGEAPGRTEDEMGRPFVGAAGNLLTKILRGFGVDRGDVYITNVVKCRPPNNREPMDDETETCSIYLLSQLLLIKPKIVIALGNHAGRWFADRFNLQWPGISRIRGRVLEGRIMDLELTVVPTYHPAAALRKPQILKYIESDIGKAIELSKRKDSGKDHAEGRKTLLDFIAGSSPSDKS